MYVERLSERERLILNMLCEASYPMMSQDLIEKNKKLSQSTVQATFRRLLNRGLVEVTGVAHSGNVLARTYVATEKAKEEVLLYVMEEYQQIRDILSIGEYIMALIRAETDLEKQRQLVRDVNNMIETSIR